ncbi:MAG: arginine deiminase family protein [Spirochaetia bacterium]
MSVYLDSEVKQLEGVILHSPGKEVESMTPRGAEEVLFNDIMPGSVVSKEHKILKSFLGTVTSVYELKDLFSEVLRDTEQREAFLSSLRDVYGDAVLPLTDLPAGELADTVITGILKKRNSLENFLSHDNYDIPPLPNLYFMRDGAAVFRNSVILGRMAHPVRRNEERVLQAVFTGHPLLKEAHLIKPESGSIEGGDILSAGKNLLLIGISERTTPDAVDGVLKKILNRYDEPMKVIAVILPKRRETIHLDMILTFVDEEILLLYEPYFFGRHSLPVVLMNLVPGKEPAVRYAYSLSRALDECGVSFSYVSCGGDLEIAKEREQWFAATNVFSFAPGKALAFEFNSATLDAFSRSGFDVRSVHDFLSGSDDPGSYRRLIVTLPGLELSRGGGGLRCMTLPFARSNS